MILRRIRPKTRTTLVSMADNERLKIAPSKTPS